MSGIMHKIEETLGGQKKDERKGEQGEVHKAGDHQGVVHKPELYGQSGQSGEHKEKEKEGFMGKIKDKLQGGEGQGGEGKKKKEKKKKEHGHEGGHSSSSSDSD